MRIPRLEEILEVVPAGKSIFLELKAGKELMAPLSTILATTRLDPTQIKIIGFDLEQMKVAKALFPHLTVYWLVEISIYIPQDRWSEEIKNTVAAAKSAGVDGLCVGGNPVANPYFISQAKAANLKFFVYTIDDGSKARRFAGMGVDGIITNRPDYIRESL
jgi:glycerophosphoryl diester phosphodiesterase